MWIHSKKIDRYFILFPHWIGLILLVLFPSYFLNAQQTSTLDWLVLILCIDVAHVYSTLFRTYFHPEARHLNGKLLILIPLLCFFAAVLAMEISTTVFWSLLAYLAVFHFIRQQYGFVNMYQRLQKAPAWVVKTDTWFVYLFTGIPILIWHVEGPKNFVWFTEHDFLFFPHATVAIGLKTLLAVLFLLLGISFFVQWKNAYFNRPKNLIILATALNWSIGIVYLNGDLAFTMLNVIAHGIPYMTLIWIQGNKSHTNSKLLRWVFSNQGAIAILLVCIFFGLIEEGIWDRLFWQEHATLFGFLDFMQPIESTWLKNIVIPLLALPQITHYVIDGFIWRKRDSDTRWKEPQSKAKKE